MSGPRPSLIPKLIRREEPLKKNNADAMPRAVFLSQRNEIEFRKSVVGKASHSSEQWNGPRGRSDDARVGRRSVRTPNFLPRGLSLDHAAYYLGWSKTKLTEMVQDGRMPPPKAVDGRRVWCRYALDDAWDDLPDALRAPSNDDNPWASVGA